MKRFDAEASLRLIDLHRITSLSVVPTNFVRWLRLPEETRARFDVSSLRVVSHSAAKCPVDVKYEMINWLGPVLIDGYGGSELGGLAAISSQEWLEHPGSVGRPLPGFEVRIVDDDGEAVAAGEVGRIFAKNSDGLDISYLGEPEKTASVHLDEWFTLGDLGSIDEDGYLYLADRRVDLIISGGVNIYPAEVEHALGRHPAIEDVAVFGVPDDEWGQEVKAAVSLRPGFYGSADLQLEIMEWARREIAHYKCPKSIDFHDSMPRQENGKLARRVLRDPYWLDR
jgi:long-chain acyl-CoA synthetase